MSNVKYDPNVIKQLKASIMNRKATENKQNKYNLDTIKCEK